MNRVPLGPLGKSNKPFRVATSFYLTFYHPVHRYWAGCVVMLALLRLLTSLLVPHLFPRLLVSSSHNAQILAFWFEAVPPLKSVICPPSCLYSWEAARRKCPGMLRACLSRADLLWHSPKAHSMFPAAILKVFILTNPKIESFILYQVSQTHPFLRQAESWNWVEH